MRITKTEEYGMRVVIRLAAERGQLTVAELADKEALPEPTVGKLLNRLKCTRIVDSVRGRGGGFELARPPERITVSDVLEALGQPALGGNACTDGSEDVGPCPHLRRCNLRPVWSHLEGLISQVFDRTTIADLLKKERRVREHLSRLTDGDTARLVGRHPAAGPGRELGARDAGAPDRDEARDDDRDEDRDDDAVEPGGGPAAVTGTRMVAGATATGTTAGSTTTGTTAAETAGAASG